MDAKTAGNAHLRPQSETNRLIDMSTAWLAMRGRDKAAMDGRSRVLAVIAGHPISPNMEVVLHNLGRMLVDTFDLHLITAKTDLSERLLQSYTPYRVPTYGWDPASIRYAYRGCGDYLRCNRPDVLLNIGQSTLALAVALWGRRANIPTAIRVTGDPLEAGLGRSFWERQKSQLIHGRIMLAACQRATRVLTLGSHVHGKLTNLGVSSDKICVRPQPFDPEPFRRSETTDQAELKRELGLCSDRQTLLFVGRLSWLKGADRLMEIIERVRADELPYQFCLVGSGEYEPRFRTYPDDLVHLAGRVSREQIDMYYRAADVMVVPSRTEGLPNVILEALAAELTIIASPVGEIPDYISRTATHSSEFVDWLQTGDWTPDPWPDWFDWETQRDRYVRFFEDMISISGES